MDYIASQLAATGPRHVQRILQLATNHNLREQYTRVKRNPKHIKRLQIERAIQVTELVDDPELLGRIAETDKRDRVINTTHEHPLWSQVPHRFKCRTCTTDILENVTTFDQLLTVTTWEEPDNSTPKFCSEQIFNTILSMPPEEQEKSWPVAFESGLRDNARAIVAVCAGRIPFDLGNNAGLSYARTGGDIGAMEISLEAEPVATKSLIALGGIFSYIPKHWELDDSDWPAVLAKDARRVLRVAQPAFKVVLDNWDILDIDSKINVLNKVESAAKLSQILVLLKPDAEDVGRDGYTRIMIGELLQRFPEITMSEKLFLLSLGGRQKIALYLAGGLDAARPQASDIPDIVDAYVNYYAEHPNQPTSEALRDSDDMWLSEILSKRCGNTWTPAHKMLMEELVEKLPAQALFHHASILSAAAHRMLWANIDGEENILMATSLLRDWEGTLPEMLAALKKLVTDPDMGKTHTVNLGGGAFCQQGCDADNAMGDSTTV